MTFFRSWLALLPLFFPLYLVRFEVGVPGFGSIPTTLLEVLVGATAAWGVGLLVWRTGGRIFDEVLMRVRIDGWAGPLGPMLLFLIAAGVSMFFVPDQTTAIDGRIVESFRMAQGIWKGWIVMPIVYFLMVYAARLTPKDWLLSKHALLFSGLVLAGWGIYQVVSGEFRTWDGRASGPFESANYLALYLGPVVMLASAEAWQGGVRRPLFRTILMVVGFLILVAGLYATKSYAAFIAVFAGLLFYGFSVMTAGGPAHFLKRRWRVVGVIVLVGIALMVTQWNTPKFQQFLDFEGRSSSTVRLEVYQVAWAMIKENPVAGIGLGQFEVQYALRAPEVLGHAPYEWVMLHPHNLALAFWLNTGLLGLAAMVWLVAGCFWRGWRRLKKDPVAAHRILLALSLLVVILVHGLFDTPFFKNDLAYLWWWVVLLGA